MSSAEEVAAQNGSPNTPAENVESVVIRFCGDSGDGMQLAGTQFTNVSAVFGNDVSTLPDFPAEIRAPAGSLAGVSGFQLCFSSNDIYTPGDEVDTLVAMNPAALKTNVSGPQTRRHVDRQRGRVLTKATSRRLTTRPIHWRTAMPWPGIASIRCR